MEKKRWSLQWGRQFDLALQKDFPINLELATFIKEKNDLFSFKNETDKKQGIVDLPGIGPAFIAIQPIITSEGKGPSMGALIAARALNQTMVDKLSKLTHLKLDFKKVSEAKMDKSYSEVLEVLKTPKDTVIKNVSENEISGFTQFSDLFNNPVSFVKFVAPREIHNQGEATILSFIIALIVAGLGFGIVISLILEKNVISRVTGLSSEIDDVQNKNDLKLRVSVSGVDEISHLGNALNNMLGSIEAGQNEISSKNRDMKLILDNAEQGFLNIELNGSIIGERSSVIDQWFGQPKNNDKLWSFLFGHTKTAKLFEMGWDQVVEDIFPFEVSVDQLPKRFIKDGSTYQVGLRPVFNNQQGLYRILAVVSDITNQVLAEKNEIEQRELVKVFQMMMSDKSAMIEFFDESSKTILEFVTHPEMEQPLQMRLIHTLKGNSAQYGLESFASLCHEIESKLVDGEGPCSQEDRLKIKMAWSYVEERFEKLLQRKSINNKLELSQQHYADLINLVETNHVHSDILNEIKSWTLEPIENRFSRLGDMANSLSDRLGKGHIHIELDHNHLRLNSVNLSEFWASMVHVIRNAVDHGLEESSVRSQNGKSTQGKIKLKAMTTPTDIIFEVSDDGKGINWETLKEKAALKGLKHQTQEELVNALFTDGVSTKDTVSEVSGRGVGMAAVKNAVEKLNGQIKVVSQMGHGTTFQFIFPKAKIEYYVPKKVVNSKIMAA
jgi:two-component system chemotaxis sensor kinase CheA